MARPLLSLPASGGIEKPSGRRRWRVGTFRSTARVWRELALTALGNVRLRGRTGFLPMPAFAPELLGPSVALFFIRRFASGRGPMVEIISNTLPSGHRDRLECEVIAALEGRPSSEDWEVSLLGSPTLARIVVFIRSPARRFRKAWVFDQPESVRDAIETELAAAGL